MTKLEAWQAWCSTAGTERLADQFTLENSSHGKAFSFAWDAAHEACAKVCEAMRPTEREFDQRFYTACTLNANAIRNRGNGD